MIPYRQAHRFHACMFCMVVLIFFAFAAAAGAQGFWPPASPEAQDFRKNMKDILFAFDQYEDPTNQAALEADVAYLMAHPEVRIRIDGYTDDRGDIIYNLVLSKKRADMAKQDLMRMGIPEERIVSAVGWGKLYPTCDFESDECWDSNRRAHLRYYWH
jgi:outer membrane protein OmpA-like peptidoglycan-associated protein